MSSLWLGWITQYSPASGTYLSSPDLKIFPVSSIHAKSAILVARTADRPFWIELVFNLDGLPLRGCNVRGKRHQQITRYTLLDRNASGNSVYCLRSRASARLSLEETKLTLNRLFGRCVTQQRHTLLK